MKEKYIKPQSDVQKFKTLNIITTSDKFGKNPADDNDVPWGT